jgi:cyclopropane-fatty-acyl-phospholipid synthase
MVGPAALTGGSPSNRFRTHMQSGLQMPAIAGERALARESGGRVASWARAQVAATLARADVQLDGPRPWDPQIHRLRTLRRVLAAGSLGAGDSYVDGDWDCDALDEMTARVLAAGIDETPALRTAFSAGDLLARLGNRQSAARARDSVLAHYDRGNQLYRAMLGPTMAYSCGYWHAAATLDEAQDAKHDLICRKLGLAPGQRVLDVGCGWGGFAKFAAERLGVEVVGCTLSDAQAEFARQACRGLPVEIRLQDYRSLEVAGRPFDRVISIGMFEHVGPANYGTFFATIRRLLAPDGLFLLHSIGGLRSEQSIDRWIDRHIFPNAVLPSASQITRASEGLFVLEDWHNFGADYERTLMAWHANFEAVWPALRAQHDERFRRMWRYYLLTCAGTFRARRNQLWQLVLSPRGVRGGYRRVAA